MSLRALMVLVEEASQKLCCTEPRAASQAMEIWQEELPRASKHCFDGVEPTCPFGRSILSQEMDNTLLILHILPFPTVFVKEDV